jgi:hypothetical protein
MRRRHTSSDGQSFHPELPVCKSLVPRNGAPSGEKRHPEYAATITTDIVGESFRPDNHQTSREHPTMAVERSPSLLQSLYRKRSGTA